MLVHGTISISLGANVKPQLKWQPVQIDGMEVPTELSVTIDVPVINSVGWMRSLFVQHHSLPRLKVNSCTLQHLSILKEAEATLKDNACAMWIKHALGPCTSCAVQTRGP